MGLRDHWCLVTASGEGSSVYLRAPVSQGAVHILSSSPALLSASLLNKRAASNLLRIVSF